MNVKFELEDTLTWDLLLPGLHKQAYAPDPAVIKASFFASGEQDVNPIS
jgi:hypothetical protein